MAKLAAAVLAMAMLALLAIAEASISRTVVTTTIQEEEEPNQGGRGGSGSQPSQRCSPQIQKQSQQLQHCGDYLSQRGPTSYNQWDTIRSVVHNPQQQEPHLRECCAALENINDPRCRCEAVQQVVRQQGGGSSQTQERQQLVQRARNLPARCNLAPHRCEIRAALMF